MTATRSGISGATVVVTGASRGIGRAVALDCAEAGADVVLAARSTDALSAVAAEAKTHGVEALCVPTDVTDDSAVEALFARTIDRFDSVDVLVNNAGIYQDGPKPTWEIEPNEWARVVDVNLNGMYRCARAVLRDAMLEQGTGTIVNMSSLFGKTGLANNTAYVVTKHAIQGLTNSLAKELRDTDIRVSAICPGQVATGMTDSIADVERLDPADVVRAVRFVLEQDPGVYVPELIVMPSDSIPLYTH